MRKALFLAMVFTLFANVKTVQAQHRRFPREAFQTETPMVHDPVMAKEGDTYYMYSTGMGIQQMTSKDRQTWTVLPQPLMTVIPGWTTDSVPGFGSHVWAPDIIQWHGRWWLAYSCSTFGKNGSAIGLLSSRSLAFNLWKDEGCIVTSHNWKVDADGHTTGDNWNAIDPNFVIDDEDTPWLVWGSFWDGIQLARLDTTMHLASKPVTIARRHRPGDPNAAENPTSRFAGRNAIEAPFIFRHGDYYYLFVSWDYCCRGAKSNYRVAVGRSRNVSGPYLDRDGKDMLVGGGTLVLEGDKKEWEAAGHCAAYTFDGEDIFICHGYSTSHKGAAMLIQRPIHWTSDGWPELKSADTNRTGQLWPDSDGNHINAHGGGILLHDGTYYWFGEHKSERTSAAMVGINCYSSSDLVNWQPRGVALSVSNEKGTDLERGCIMERPKVIYNEQTGKFVMWFHLELRHRGYEAARYGVAVSDSPEGPYTYLYSSRANAGQWPVEFTDEDIQRAKRLNMKDFKEWWTPEWTEAVRQGLFVNRDLGGGQMSRDMTLYVDTDGTAYHIYSSEENLTLHIAELTPDYLHHTGRYTRVAPAGHNEAPTLFLHDGTYWMITSGCTGWEPNAARMFSAPSIWGPWTQHPNPCVGPNAEKTFGGQGTYVLTLPDSRHIFMADIWRPRHPIDARYIWLPITFSEGKPVIQWQDEWTAP